MGLEFESIGAEEISVFHKLLLEKGTKPFRLAVCPADIKLQARLLPPVPPLVPPPVPPVFAAEFDTPEQAVNNSARAKGAERARRTLQAEQGQRIYNDCLRPNALWKEAFGTCPNSANGKRTCHADRRARLLRTRARTLHGRTDFVWAGQPRRLSPPELRIRHRSVPFQ